MQHQHRDVRLIQHEFGDAAKNPLTQATPAISPHDQEIRVRLLVGLENRLCIVVAAGTDTPGLDAPEAQVGYQLRGLRADLIF